MCRTLLKVLRTSPQIVPVEGAVVMNGENQKTMKESRYSIHVCMHVQYVLNSVCNMYTEVIMSYVHMQECLRTYELIGM